MDTEETEIAPSEETPGETPAAETPPKRRGVPPYVFAVLGVALGLVVAFTVPRILSHPAPSTGVGAAPTGPAAGLAAEASVQLRATLSTGTPVTSVLYAPDGRSLLIRTTAGLQVWDIAAGKQTRTIAVGGASSPSEVGPATVSTDGQTFVDGTKLWSLATGQPIATLGHYDSIEPGPFELSPDGRAVAAVGTAGDVRNRRAELFVWQVANPATPTYYEEPGFVFKYDSVNAVADSVAFSPDGRTVAVGGSYLFPADGSGQAVLWDIAGGRVSARITSVIPDGVTKSENANNSVHSLAFTPDGRILVTSTQSVDAKVRYTGIRLWETATGKMLADVAPTGGGTVAVSRDGKLFSFGAASGGIEIWSVADRKPVTTLKLSGEYLGGQVFSPDGATIAVPVGNTVQLWSLA